ncbi:chloramphenicol 3-O-phosphotransferase [Kineococcus xinjiangensis]|uniref:Chloramphenicol 3-O-phosphotransferase n=1 Tax=Kineococcus xinjiangensis TaxID=512762 RepID=A0A2S6IH15_9ACTN|nr:AAA family ATPase [Kineococcus xinjiangensis]PPK93508.1 chloramphenicol 3-O-phosphotransferase [Kineococcus xinjiangensis]
MTGTVLLLAGPAGAGKSTLARRWCATRRLAAHVEVDAVWEMVRQGRVDPRDAHHPDQSRQWLAAVRATCALARSYADSGLDVVVDDVLRPSDARGVWEPELHGLPLRLVAVLPSLRACLERGAQRGKEVPEALVRLQYEASRRWESERQLDTTGQDVEESAAALVRLAEDPAAVWP